ncbi:MAG TPA: protein YgfX [Casimicrobiaceae bacterium]|nr:protein YgfX [Casimicrobiaceae bacterium]
MKGPAPLFIALAPSRLAAAFVVGAVIASATLVALLPFDAPYRALAIVAMGAQGIHTLRTWAFRSTRPAVVGIEVSTDGGVALIDRRGIRRQGSVRPASYVGTWLVTLVARVDGERWSRAIAILPDMVPAEEMRRLRVMLRIAGSARSALDSGSVADRNPG